MGQLEKPIMTQEELDSIIGERLKRDREVQAKKYDGYVSPDDLAARIGEYEKKLTDAKTQADGYAAQVAEKDAAIKKYEAASVKSRIADEIGLDRRLIARIGGETEDEIRQDALSLKALFDQSAPVVPLASTEKPVGNAADAAYKSVLRSIREGET